jgi:hypothetical protein
MDLMERAKQVAGEMGELAKKGASQVQAKIERAQRRRKADDAAMRLGYLVVRERSEGRSPGAEVDELVAEVRYAEALVEAADAAADTAAPGPTTPVADVQAPATPSAALPRNEGEAAGE